MIRVLINTAGVVTCQADLSAHDAGCRSSTALAWDGERIVWVGPLSDLDAHVPADARELVDGQGCLVLPGLVDCHSHLAFGGWRADEFAQRCRGVTYQEIAAAGGGILRTVADTRAASEEELLNRCLDHCRAMLLLGITTIECKSGYGLSLDDELKLLRVYRRLADQVPQTIVPTLLAAHTIPPEYRRRRDHYVQLVCREIIPEVSRQQLAEFCDVFVEEGAFSREEARQVLRCGLDHGLIPKLHVDQLTGGKGAELAAELLAASADHLEYASPEGIEAMAAAGVVAVTLPLASLYLRQPPLDARKFLQAGVPVAVATDFNPGSAPSYHLHLAMNLACTLNQMSPAEAVRGATIVAARAVRRDASAGSLEAGKQADFILVDAPSIEHWLYQFRANAVRKTFVRGRCVAESNP